MHFSCVAQATYFFIWRNFYGSQIKSLKKHVIQLVLKRFRDINIDADGIADSRAIIFLKEINCIVYSVNMSDSEKVEKIKGLFTEGLIDNLCEEQYLEFVTEDKEE